MNGKSYWVNAKKSGLYTQLLNSIIGQFDAVLSYHSKVHVLRFDLHQNAYTENNKRLTIFNRRFFKWLKRQYDLNRIGFVWVREHDQARQQHYHYALMIDGHKVNHPLSIQNKAVQVWADMNGYLFWPENPYYNVNRGDHDEIQQTIYRLSYLAKTRSKDKRPPQTKDIGTSRIKKHNQQY